MNKYVFDNFEIISSGFKEVGNDLVFDNGQIVNKKEGFTVVENYEPVQVPQTITKLQAMKQMKNIGKWEVFKVVLANDEDINDEWILSDNLNRAYPLVLRVAQLFEFSDEDMDTFFIEASKL